MNRTSQWMKSGRTHEQVKRGIQPSYVGVFEKGQIIGYHCNNEEIAWLEQATRPVITTLDVLERRSQ